MALVVTRDATVVVRAPWRTPVGYIEDYIYRNSAWIRRKLAEMARRQAPRARKFVSGEEFLYLGKFYKLQVVDELASDVELGEGFFISKKAAGNAREVMARWYKTQAAKKISERCSWYAKATGLAPTSIKVSNAEKRWRSCGPAGTLNFSWRLVMAPLRVIDYVVVHELVHLKEKNHSNRFWMALEAIMPDYHEGKRWLKDNGLVLRV